MKTILTTIILLISISTFAQEIKNANGHLLATIDEAGIVKDENNHSIGQFLLNGEVRDGNGDLIGTIDENNFKDMNGATIGSINVSGEVFDVNEMKIGEIPSMTQIKNQNGEEVVTTSLGIDKKRLAAYYFFYFNTII